MLITEFIFSISILIIVFITGLITADKFANKSIKSITKNQNSESDIDDKNSETTNKFKLSDLHIKAGNLAKSSIGEAANIITGINATNEHLTENLDKLLHQMASQNIHELKTTSSNFNEEYKILLQNLENDIKVSVYKMIQEAENQFNLKMDTFLKDLLKQGTSTQAVVDQKTSEMLTIATADIEEYKKLKMASVDEEIKNLIKKVYNEVLQQSIPEDLHHELIMESLENAKKDGIFKP